LAACERVTQSAPVGYAPYPSVVSDASPAPDAVPELVDAFRFEAARLGSDFARASTLGRGTAQEIADHRENAFRQLVGRFFPAPHHVTRGQALAVDGARSASIDCLVLNPAHPNLVDRAGKFTLIFADGVDFGVDVKGRLTGDELRRFLRQGRSLKQVVRSKTPLLSTRRNSDEIVEGSKRIPTYGYCHETALSPETAAEAIGAWVAEEGVPALERPDALAIHGQGILLDTSNPAGPARQMLRGADVGLYWLPSVDLTLGHLILLMNQGLPAVAPVAEPVLRRYGSVSGTAHRLLAYP
jgi:hypothetical protein